MPLAEKHIKKNSLNIRLTESAVFLRTDDPTGRNLRNDSRPSVLRGLLTLDLAKPTKITSIELELQAKSSTAWPEGIGARRMDMTEEHRVFYVNTVFFRASEHAPRRTASIGPGVATHDEMGLEEYDEDLRPQFDRAGSSQSITASTNSRRSSAPRGARHMSADYNSLQRHSPFGHHEEFHDLPPVPPYSPTTTTPSLTPGAGTPSSTSSDRPSLSPSTSARHLDLLSTVHESPAQTLEGFRNALRADLSTDRRSSSAGYGLSQLDPISSASSIRSLSRRPSIEDVPEDGVADVARSPHTSPPPSHPASPADSVRSESRGRRRGRFSLTSMGNVLLDAIRPSTSRSRDESRIPKGSRERSIGTDELNTRGRRRERNTVNFEEDAEIIDDSVSPAATVYEHGAHRSHERTGFGRISEALGLDGGVDEDPDHEWKEFKKGTYNYPIAFSIPGHAPPSLETNFGSVKWELKATVHRPGAFKAKIGAHRPVIVVTCPTEEDTEESENIIVERHWDNQLQYLISVSGRSFYIGGTIPVSFTMLPLAKIKIHRIMVYIEEKTEYFVHFKRVARTDPIARTNLLSIKDDGKTPRHILPLDSDEARAFEQSAMYRVLTADDDPSEMASNFMGPGPWTFSQELKLPQSCKMMRFTNKNRRSNMTVTHTLKCVIRVERGDDQALDERTGKRKLFDIVVQTPVQILSCRCNPEWTMLPHYSEYLEDSATSIPPCPCTTHGPLHQPLHPRVTPTAPDVLSHGKRRPTSLERHYSHSSDSGASAIETTGIHPTNMQSLRNLDTLVGMNTEYEMLVSGMLTEAGEAPPSYGSVAA